jgi:preprotein translocase subunit SecG
MFSLLAALPLAAFGDVFWPVLWHVLGVLLVLISLVLIVVILMQDSKGAGLTSAFGAGPGGESLLGARMQRDVARYTAYLTLIFTAIVIAMGLIGNHIVRFGSVGAAGAQSSREAPASSEAGQEADDGLPFRVLTPPGQGEGAPPAPPPAPSGGPSPGSPNNPPPGNQ